MPKKILKPFPAVAVFMLVMSMVQVGTALIPEKTAALAANRQIMELRERVRRTLPATPNHGVFDDLSFAIQDDAVTLTGEVRKSVLQSEARRGASKNGGSGKRAQPAQLRSFRHQQIDHRPILLR